MNDNSIRLANDIKKTLGDDVKYITAFTGRSGNLSLTDKLQQNNHSAEMVVDGKIMNENLKKIRNELGLSQKEFAKVLIALLCVMCVCIIVGCQKKEVINSENISGESDEKVSGESDLKDASGILSGDETNIDNNEKACEHLKENGVDVIEENSLL